MSRSGDNPNQHTDGHNAGDRLHGNVARPLDRDSVQRYYRTILENFPNGAIFVFDRDQRYIYADGAGLREVGLGKGSIVGKTMFEVFPPHVAEITTPVCEAVFEGKPGRYEVEYEGHVYECQALPVHSEDGQIHEGLVITIDVTERRRLEQQLRQSQKMEAVGQLAGGVAHDFNNILTAILGNTELLAIGLAERIPGGDPLLASIEQIQRSARRAAELTRRLLTFSRREISQPQVLDPRKTIADTEEMLVRLIPENVELSIELAAEAWPIRIDASQLEQVVLNLVLNARDAMPTGGQLRVTTTNVDLDSRHVTRYPDARHGPHVCVAVSDTGEGMLPEVVEHIFEPFYTTKSMGDGTGLGLATVHGIVQQAGGHITVYTEVGHGTTFKVYFPASLGAVDGHQAAVEDDLSGGTETILVCEDDPAVRQFTMRTLRRHGYEVLEARDTADAVRIAGEHADRVHLLLTDVIMPGLNGRELANAVLERRRDIRVLYVSGYSADVITARGVLAGEVELLEKPFSGRALLRRVRQILDKPE